MDDLRQPDEEIKTDPSNYKKSEEKIDTQLSGFDSASRIIEGAVHASSPIMLMLFFLTPFIQIFLSYKELKIAQSVKDKTLEKIAQGAIIFYAASFISGCVFTGIFIYNLAMSPSILAALQTLATVIVGLSSLFIINSAVTAAIAYARMYCIRKRIKEISKEMSNNMNDHVEKRTAYEELLNRHIDLHQKLHQKNTEITAQKDILDHAKSEYHASQEQHNKNITSLKTLEKQFYNNRLMARYMTITLALGITALLVSNPIGLSVVGLVGLMASVAYVFIKIHQSLRDKNEEKIDNILDKEVISATEKQDDYTQKLEEQLGKSIQNSESLSEKLPPLLPPSESKKGEGEEEDKDSTPEEDLRLTLTLEPKSTD